MRGDRPITQLAEEAFALAAQGVEVAPAPVEEIVGEARVRRRRRRRAVGLATAGIVLVIGVATWSGSRQTAEPESGPTGVTREESSADTVWWAAGVLHLPHVTVDLPRVEQVARLGDGAVVGDDEGNVVLVAPDGVTTTIGREVPGAPLVSSEHQGWAVWVDPQDRAPQLVVYDVGERQVLAIRELEFEGPRWGELDPGSHPIAVDGDQVYYADQRGDWAWQPEEARLVNADDLLDVSAATLVRRAGQDHIRVIQPFFSVEYVRRGRGAQISPGGEYVLTRTTSERSSGQFGPVRIYDTRSGHRLWTGLEPGEVAMATSMGPDDEVTYLVAHRTGERQDVEFTRASYNGPLEMRTCHLGERSCFQVTTIPQTGVLPILAD
jgi:hypothetical protein